MATGDLLVIGGAEDKLKKRTVLRDFVERAGGSEARIAVIPTASSLGDEVVEVYEGVFGKLGAAEVIGVRPESREDAHDPAVIAPLREATGIFMTGGNQLKLSGVISGTPFGEAIRDAHERGVIVAGTSAGASIQSSHMVAFGTGGATPKQRMTQVAAGLGLLQDMVIDQHFDQRNRYGRLLMIVAQSPQLLGMGVDEDTAALISTTDDGQVMQVLGRGAITIFDPAHIVTDAHEVQRSRPIMTSGIQLHVLTAGHAFHLGRRELVPPAGVPDDDARDQAAEALGVSKDLRKLVRDIAAADTSPSALKRRLARRTKGAN
jgi:cyanophycinase